MDLHINLHTSTPASTSIYLPTSTPTPVRPHRPISMYLRRYVQHELLTGSNQYRATGHGLQDAKKG